MLGVDCAVGPSDSSLDIAESGIDPFEGGRAPLDGSGVCDDYLVGTTGFDHDVKTAHAIADHGAIRAQEFFDERQDRTAAKKW